LYPAAADLRGVARLLPPGNPVLPAGGLQPEMVRRDPRPEEVRRRLLAVLPGRRAGDRDRLGAGRTGRAVPRPLRFHAARAARKSAAEDRKSTRLNSSHLGISYAVF